MRASLKNAFISMGGAVVHHATIPENARQLFYQTWPGWTYGTYRAFDLPAEDVYLADLIPWSATFAGHLEDAEAIYNGARGNLVGIRMRLGKTPQHGVLFGMTGAGKSVIIADLLAQIGHRFGFRLVSSEEIAGLFAVSFERKPMHIKKLANSRWKNGRCFRHPRTTNERRANCATTTIKEIIENHGVTFKVRPTRNSHRLPTSYDDIFLQYQRNWKKYRRTQWKDVDCISRRIHSPPFWVV